MPAPSGVPRQYGTRVAPHDWSSRFADVLLRYPVLLCALNALVWFIAGQIAFQNLDPYGDMVETFAMTPNWELGTFKHPPLMGWVAKSWFLVWPREIWAFYLLSSVCLLIGMLGVFRLARLFLPLEQSVLAVLALGLTLPFSTLGFKYNANSILLPIWPWLACLFVTSWRGGSWRHAVALGALAALGMLGKYFTGVLLASMFIAAVATPSGRQWLRTPAPYLAAAVCMLCLAPHIVWLLQHGAPTIAYAEKRGGVPIAWDHLASFLLSPFSYAGLAWLLALWAAFRGKALFRIRQSFRRTGPDDVLFWLTFAPLAIVAFFALAAGMTLTLHWAIPVVYAFPVFWLTRATAPDAAKVRWAMGALPTVWATLMAAGALFAVAQGLNGALSHYREDAAIARQLLRASPVGRIVWVGGSWPEAAIVPFFADRTVRALPGLPDHPPLGVSPVMSRLSRLGAGALLCRLNDAACQRESVAWLKAKGLPAIPSDITATRQGWLFPLKIPTTYRVYWYR
ncbi:hypothetical protein GCM10011289_28940 [Paludibacterium paludis]|uniref:Glycosyltransferase RgtA/B/C/D-like domain-containing protein n=2 Tax=Paludibacterium paludis TaxID=1225769 RepID=A0A918UBJ2_9NEIS|nr:hypothetical protein GCM10011289_28940 [Paludibacterium paludis]